MRRLILLALGLSIIFSMLGLAAVMYGRAYGVTPEFPPDLGLGWCQGKLCFRGIVPGVTSWDQAVALLIHNPDNATVHNTIENGTISVADDPEIDGIVRSSVDGATIQDIDISVTNLPAHPSILRLVPFIAQFGPPCYIYLRRETNTNSIKLTYPHLVLILWGVGGHLEFNSPVDAIYLPGRSVNGFCNPGGAEGNDVIADWHGFASMSYYVSHPRFVFQETK